MGGVSVDRSCESSNELTSDHAAGNPRERTELLIGLGSFDGVEQLSHSVRSRRIDTCSAIAIKPAASTP